jgi:microcystin-dependent protein
MVKITGSAIQFSATNQQTSVYPAIGTILLWGGQVNINTLSSDYLICDGSSISKTEYSDLYSIIGNKYGESGDNFNLPNLRERIPIGANNTTSVQYNGTYTGGVNKLEPNHYPHTHILSPFTYTITTGPRRGAETEGGDPPRVTCSSVGTTDTDAAPQPFVSSTGDPANSLNYYPPYTLVNYIIRAKYTTYHVA